MADDFEILAPVGNMAMLEAAVKAGCDAVYIGGKLYSARAFADNFSDEDMEQAVKFCHINNVKLYVTVNTLIHDYEMDEAIKYIFTLYNMDVDAVILQDIGLIKRIRELLPDLEIHGSTQMNINNYYGAKLMEQLGLSRIVLARETPFEEIKLIKEKLDIQVEVFVHGSLCVCSSGQCLLSSYIGGRSGNRGKCAQPCRKDYDICDGKKVIIGNIAKSYLSPRDLCTIDDLERLMNIGVDSFKIEGRMKKPEYVYIVVKSYKDKVLGIKDELQLDEVSNRGFTNGLIFGDFGVDYAELNRGKSSKGKNIGIVSEKSGKRIIEFTDEVYKGDILNIISEKDRVYPLTMTDNYPQGSKVEFPGIYDAKLKSFVKRVSSINIKNQLANALSHQLIRKVDMVFEGKIGQLPKLTVKYRDFTFESLGDLKVNKAINAPVTREEVVRQLSKLANTSFRLNSIETSMDEDIFLPIKTINKLRRDCISQLTSHLQNNNKRPTRKYVEKSVDLQDGIRNKSEIKLSVEVFKNELIKEIPMEKIKRVYIHNLEHIEGYDKLYYKVPRLMDSQKIDEIFTSLEDKNCNIEGFLVNNLGDIQLVKDRFPEKKIVCDIGINAFNRDGLELLKAMGIDVVTISSELNLDEIEESVANVNMEIEGLGYGLLTSMIMKQCPFSGLKGCKDDKNCNNCKFKDGHYLLDEYNEYYKVNRLDGYSELYFYNKLDIIDNIEDIEKSGVDTLRLTFDETDSIPQIIKDYYNETNKNIFNMFISRKEKSEDTTTGHYYRGIK